MSSSSLTVVFPSAVNIDELLSGPTVDDPFDTTSVVTTVPHGYGVGLFVTIYIPYANGEWNRINGQTFAVTSVDDGLPKVFTIQLNSTAFGLWDDAPSVTVSPPPPAVPFEVPSQMAQCVPTGEEANTLEFATNVIGPNNRP